MKKLLIVHVMTLVLLAFGLPVFSEKTLTFATWLSPSHPHNADIMPTWSKWVEKATEGRVKVKIEHYVGHPKDLFNGVEDGTYAGGWSYHGYTPGRFILTKLVELPSMVGDPEQASSAYWNVHQKYLKKANEHDGLKLIGLFVHGPGQIMMKTPIKSLADLKGKKIRVGGGIQANIAKQFGVVTVPAPGSKVYEILQTGVADGVFMPTGELKTLNLHEVVKQVYKLPKGMYLGSFSIFLNPDFMASLSKKDQKAIMAVSGEKLSRYAGKVWGENDKNGIAAAIASNVKIVNASKSDVKKFNSMTSDFEKQWLKEAKKYKNVDAKKALRKMKKMTEN